MDKDGSLLLIGLLTVLVISGSAVLLNQQPVQPAYYVTQSVLAANAIAPAEELEGADPVRSHIKVGLQEPPECVLNANIDC